MTSCAPGRLDPNRSHLGLGRSTLPVSLWFETWSDEECEAWGTGTWDRDSPDLQRLFLPVWSILLPSQSEASALGLGEDRPDTLTHCQLRTFGITCEFHCPVKPVLDAFSKVYRLNSQLLAICQRPDEHCGLSMQQQSHTWLAHPTWRHTSCAYSQDLLWHLLV